MIQENWRVIHYINQFFAGIGGEDKARTGLFEKHGAMGPGRILEKAVEGRGTLVATLYCGDDYFVENQEETLDRALEMVRKYNPDVLIAGPAFNAGRYGQACGALCSHVQSRLGIPAVTGMYSQNPGADLYRKGIYIVETPQRVKDMPVLLRRMLELGIRLAKKEPIGPPGEEGYIPRGVKKNIWVKQTAAERAADMLLDKLAGRPFETEIKPPKFDTVPPPPPLRDLTGALIALVTDGGIVPLGNPDAMPGASGKVFGKYSILGLDQMSPETFECIHAGMNKQISAADPNRMVPLDVMRELNKAGKVGALHDWIYSTSGCTVEYENAVKMGREIATDLLKSGVSGVILTSAWGTSTRCGAAIGKEIERAGIPVAHLAALYHVAGLVGSNRVMKAEATSHPLGKPEVSLPMEKAMRRRYVEKALKVLQEEVKEKTIFSIDG